MKTITVAIADDHWLVRAGLILLVNEFKEFKVVCDASNGRELIERVTKLETLPDVALIDVSMPIMNGFETLKYIEDHELKIKCIGLSVYGDYKVVTEMMDAGARAYLFKDSSPELFKQTMLEVFHKDFFLSPFVEACRLEYHKKIRIQKKQQNEQVYLTAREMEFVKLCCFDLPYKVIADKMKITESTVNDYRVSVFDKLGVHSKTGIVLYAIRNKLFDPFDSNSHESF